MMNEGATSRTSGAIAVCDVGVLGGSCGWLLVSGAEMSAARPPLVDEPAKTLDIGCDVKEAGVIDRGT